MTRNIMTQIIPSPAGPGGLIELISHFPILLVIDNICGIVEPVGDCTDALIVHDKARVCRLGILWRLHHRRVTRLKTVDEIASCLAQISVIRIRIHALENGTERWRQHQQG